MYPVSFFCLHILGFFFVCVCLVFLYFLFYCICEAFVLNFHVI